MIKNRRADITLALKQVTTQRRIALTGSPLQNNLMEYYCVRSSASLLFCLLIRPITDIIMMLYLY
jgi:SNF2 family DNA or RNA helicase